MKDSWGPLKALAAASVINGVGDIFLCSVCGYGIAGAAWATMVSQVQTHLTLSLSPCDFPLMALLTCYMALSIFKEGMFENF
jgi:hypothetical protein